MHQPFYRTAIVSTATALLAAGTALAFFRSNLIAWVQDVFVDVVGNSEVTLSLPTWQVSLLLIGLPSLAAYLVVERMSTRKALPYLGGGLLFLAIVSLIASRLFLFDILFPPTLFAAAISALIAHTQRLSNIDLILTKKLLESSNKPTPLGNAKSSSRLASSLKLLDTVLSPKEAVVFQRDAKGKLISVARLRASSNGLETARNSTWRKGIEQCERSISTRELITQQLNNGESYTNVSVPLCHEDRAVGALLVRVGDDFDAGDSALLLALAGQLARNLHREETFRHTDRQFRKSYMSTTASARRLELMDVLYGVLAEQRFGINMLAEISDGIAIAYLDGTLAYVNPAFLQFARLSREHAEAFNLFDLLQTLRTSVFDEPAIAVRRVLQTGEAYERELQFSDRSEVFGLRISLVIDQVTPVEGKRQPVCLAVSVRDLTRLKELAQMKSDMISLMSHELRTPITSINGFSELLMADNELSEQTREFVTIIANESQRLSRMINTFLAVTQLERKDKQEVLKIPLRLDDIVRETVVNLQPMAKKKRIRLVEQVNQRIPPVAADKSLISQAVKNLVSNAIKYSPERTTVTVSTALEAEAVRLCVEDRGFGIPSEAVDRVWEKFYRVTREGQDKDDESTGLGLSFVREVVEQHGGAVSVETEEGRGSKFSFTLPRL